MVDVRVRSPIASSDISELRALADAIEAARGHPAFGDAVWRDLARADPTAMVAIAQADGGVVGALHAAAPENTGARQRIGALAVLPDHWDTGVPGALLDALIAELLAGGGVEHASVWVFGADASVDAVLAGARWTRERELWQMRVPLPLRDAPDWPPDFTIRPFEPGRDDVEWLAVNNRAFAADPDQSNWTLATLHGREEQPWFDARGFLLALDGERLAGFCWTKIHDPRPPHEPHLLGEIYVIGVDPDYQGTGLGRALTTGGLASLSERGAAVGMLFVDAANEPAIALYRALGFELARVDRAYGRGL
jgi:mycothiol synthase